MKVDPRLHRIADSQPYPLLFATVSGAHLYGFPSPDSDFDLRAAHIRKRRQRYRSNSSDARSGVLAIELGLGEPGELCAIGRGEAPGLGR
jgi:hypothetical protein